MCLEARHRQKCRRAYPAVASARTGCVQAQFHTCTHLRNASTRILTSLLSRRSPKGVCSGCTTSRCTQVNLLQSKNHSPSQNSISNRSYQILIQCPTPTRGLQGDPIDQLSLSGAGCPLESGPSKLADNSNVSELAHHRPFPSEFMQCCKLSD